MIGRGGSVLKQAGTDARRELEALLGVRVHLETHVQGRARLAAARRTSLDRLGPLNRGRPRTPSARPKSQSCDAREAAAVESRREVTAPSATRTDPAALGSPRGRGRQMFDRMHRLRRGAVVAVAVLAAAAVLAGCGGRQRQRPELARPDGPDAQPDPRSLHAVLLGRGRHRRRRHRRHDLRRRCDSGRSPAPERSPKQIHGNTVLEISWTIIPALILVVMAVFTIPVDLRPRTSEPDGRRRRARQRHRPPVVLGVRVHRRASSSPPTRCTSRSTGRSA